MATGLGADELSCSYRCGYLVCDVFHGGDTQMIAPELITKSLISPSTEKFSHPLPRFLSLTWVSTGQ
jgi:hypothetical protein